MKKNQLNTFLITIGLAMVILYIAKPKNSIFNIANLGSKSDSSKKKASEKVAPPLQVSNTESQNQKNGMIIIDAMRNAINDNIPQAEIDKLNKSFIEEFNMKVLFGEKNKLVAKTPEGKIIAQE